MNDKTKTATTVSSDCVSPPSPPDDDSQAWNNIDAGSAKQVIAPPESSPSGPSTSSLFKALSDEFVNEQEKLQTHRERLIQWFTIITVVQLVVVNVLVFFAFFGRQETIQTVLTFMSCFVGATFVELIGGLYIIVRYVFSHTTSDMLKHLTPVNINNSTKTE